MITLRSAERRSAIKPRQYTTHNVIRLFLTVLFVVGLHGLLCVTSRVDHVRPCYVGMVRRFFVMSGLVVLCCFTVMMGSVGKMFLHLLVVLGSFFRHCRFLPG
jgi:hypothetical protein